MYMVNQIDLSDVNMRTLLLMILHDLPHDYKVKRLENLWEKTKLKSYTQGGGVVDGSVILLGLAGLAGLARFYIFGQPTSKEDPPKLFPVITGTKPNPNILPLSSQPTNQEAIPDEVIPDEVYNKIDIPEFIEDNLGLYKVAINIVYETLKLNPENKTSTKLKDEYTQLIYTVENVQERASRGATIRKKNLADLVSLLQIQILNALSSSSKKGGEGPPGLIGISDSSSDDSNRGYPSTSKYPLGELLVPQEFHTPENLSSNNEFHTPETPSSNNEYLTPHITQQEESLPSTSRPQTNKTNPPTVTTNRTKNKKKKSRKKRNIRTRRTRRRNRRTRKRNKEKLNNANDIRLKNNIAMNEIFKNAFEIVYNDTNNSEIKEIITAFYTFYSMIKITSEISPLDAFNSDYVKSSLLIYMILKRSSFDADLKIIFDTVFSSHNTFKGGGELSGENRDLIETYTREYKKYYTGAEKIRKTNPDIATLKYNVLELIDLFKTNGKWNEELLKTYNIKSNTIIRQLNTIKIKESILTNAIANSKTRDSRVQYNANLEDTIKTQYLKIMFENIIIPFEKNENKITKIQEFSSITPLKTIAIQNPHGLVSALMKGVFKYSGIEEVNGQSLDAEFYNAEFGRLKLVSEGKGIYLSGDVLDSKLLEDFKTYADEKSKNAILWSIDNKYPSGYTNKNTDIINNGFPIDTLEPERLPKANRLTKGNVRCTLSQRVDAMGNFGDCSTRIHVHESEQNTPSTLSYTTDIGINAQTSGDYYISRMEEIDNNGREINISYSLKLKDLETPFFFKTIDSSATRILDLSLTNTYQSVITRVLYMWANANTPTIEGENYTEEDIQKLYDIIIANKDTFIDLLLTALQKGSGDNNQEFNAVFKDRGYILQTEEETTTDPFYKNSLLYVANDRPSAVRAMFTLINGSGSINNNVTAGFPPQYIYITRPRQ